MGHLFADLLSKNNEVIAKHIAREKGLTRPGAAAPSDLSGNGLPAGRRLPQGILLSGSALCDEVRCCALPEVLKTVADILKLHSKVTPMSKVGRPSANLALAVNLLHDFGLVKRCPYKRPGSTGYAPMYLVKNDNFANPVAELSVANFLRDVLKSDPALFRRQAMDNLGYEVLPHARAQLPTLTSEYIDGLNAKWTPILDRGADSTEAGGISSDTCVLSAAQAPSNTAAEPLPNFDRERILGMRSHFQWILKSSNPAVHLSYVSSRIPGFQKDGDDFAVMQSTMCALGLARDIRRGSSKGAFAIVGPPSPDDVAAVVSALNGLFGQFTSLELDRISQKFHAAAKNQDFDLTYFERVVQELREVTNSEAQVALCIFRGFRQRAELIGIVRPRSISAFFVDSDHGLNLLARTA